MDQRMNENGHQEKQSIGDQLARINDYIEREIAYKQYVIYRLEYQLEEAFDLGKQKQETISQLQKQLEELRRTAEGNRQLMNKLLNDIENYQKDIGWYKKTYEQRSLLGIIKDKFVRRDTDTKSNGNDRSK